VPQGCSELSTRAALQLLKANRAYIFLTAATGFYALSVYGMAQWIPAFLVRSHGMSLQAVGAWFGIAFGLGLTAGMLLSGWTGTKLATRGLDRPMIVSAGCAAVAIVLFGAMLWVPNPAVAISCAAGATVAAAFPAPQTVAAIQNVCDARVRATAAALAAAVGSIVGIGVGPVVIGALSDALAPTLGNEALRSAMTLSLALQFGGVWTYWAAGRALGADKQRAVVGATST
jgi:MFS family permease